MNKKSIKWYIPSSFKEAVDIHLNDNLIIPTGGTTGIFRIKRDNFNGFINLKNCNLSYIKGTENTLYIGASTKFNELIDYLKIKNSPTGSFENMLCDALSNSASYPLRNRITVGGSIFDLPLWSDLISPLLIANTKVIYNDNQEMELYDYIRKRKKFAHIIKEVVVKYDKTLNYFSSRFSLTNFDYAVMRISLSFSEANNKFNTFSCCVSGTKNIVFFDNDFNKKFIGIEKKDKDKIKEKLNSILFGFSSDYKFSSEYKEQMAKVIFLDLLDY